MSAARTPATPRNRRVGRAALLCGTLLAALPLGHGVARAAAVDVEVERLAGPTRYETAAATAERYVAESPGRTDAAIVVSGDDEHAPCALAAAALAGAQNAPLLLSESGSLPAATEAFLGRFDFRRVFIVGGTAHLSDSVAQQLRRVTGTVPRRLGGAGCSDVALTVARHVGNVGAVAGLGRTALLTTDESPADGVAAGPLAYRGRMPLLLTNGGEIGAPLRHYLVGSVDHVIILGGRAAVSESTERQIRALGVTTQRWSGPDRYATAARIATEMLADGAPVSCADGAGVGLAAGFGLADAIASAPLLGQRCEPLLLTETLRLPRSAAEVLAADTLAGDATGRLRLTLFGGSAAISAATQVAATAAAAVDNRRNGDPVAASVRATEGACHWIVQFSRPVRSADARTPANYTFDRQPLTASQVDIHAGTGDATTQAVIVHAGASAYDTESVPIGCATPLAVRDRLGVTARTIRSADGSGRNERAELTVRADTTGPQLSVFAPLGGDTIWIRSDEALTDGTVTVTLTRGRSRLTQTASVSRGDTDIHVTFSFPDHDSFASAVLPFTEPPSLSPGDTITVATGGVSDRAGNAIRAGRHTVAADNTPPQVSSVSVSSTAIFADGSAAVDITVVWSEPVQGCGLGPDGETIILSRLQIDFDSDGFVDFSLEGAGTSAAGVSFIEAPDVSPWIRAGTAACDQSWWRSDGTLVARVAARSPSMLPRVGSSLLIGFGAAYDFAGNPTGSHTASLAAEAADGR